MSIHVTRAGLDTQQDQSPQGWLAPLQLTWGAKGPAGLAERLRTVTARFGPTPERMVRRLRAYADFGMATGVAPTWPITAVVLARHPEAVRPFVDAGVEFAIHGLYHNDYALMPGTLQLRDITLAQSTFQRAGIPTVGFRAPYLRANDATADAVAAAGLTYVSNQAIMFGALKVDLTPSQQRAHERALQLYDAHDGAEVASRPQHKDGLIHIPVTIPDDEIMVDRLGLTALEQAEVWIAMLETIHEQGDLLTVQLHPERWPDCASAAAGVVSRAAELPGGVWTARLDEIAHWWLARAACRLTVERLDEAHVQVSLEGDPRAALLVRSGGDGETSESSRRLTIPSRRLPVIGVEPAAPARLVAMLKDEGYPVVVGAPAEDCVVHLDHSAGDLTDLAIRRRLAAATGPLVRIAPWPQGHRSALALSGDIDALTFQDFVFRIGENAQQSHSRNSGSLERGRT